MEPRDWLRPADVADVLGVPVLRVQRWLKAGNLRGKKIGGMWFVHRSEIEAAYGDGGPPHSQRSAVSDTNGQ